MSIPSSNLVYEYPEQVRPKWPRWGMIGAIAGAIAAIVLFFVGVPILAAGLEYRGTWFSVAPIGLIFLLLHSGFSWLTGVAAGFLFSRLRPGWGVAGAVIGGLILEIALGSIYVNDRLPYLLLPKFEDDSTISGPNHPRTHLFVVADDFSEADALKVGNFYGARHSDAPLIIEFYCLEGHDTKPFRPEYMLYRYTRSSKTSSPTINTPLNPVHPNQGKKCK